MFEISELPFPLGSTASTGITPVDPTILMNLEGIEFIVRDQGIDGDRNSQGTGRVRRLRLVKNNAGVPLLPKRAVALTNFGRYAGGYPAADADPAAVVDDQLPPAGVPDQDHFYVNLAGPTLCTTDATPGVAIAVGDSVYAVGAASGRVKFADYTGAGVTLAKAIRNTLGEAGSAKTTANTGQDILIDMRWR